MDRRQFLWNFGGGLGGIALAQMLSGETHFPARAKRVVQLFMSGAASQCDTFDYKPELIRRHGEKFDPGGKVELFQSSPGAVMQSPWEWKQRGQCGKWVSDLVPHIASCADDIAFVHSMMAKSNVHGPATFMQNTGFVLPGFPCMGSWVSYGLGSMNQNLPTFIVLPDSRGFAPNGPGNWSAGFLPASQQGTMIRASSPNPIYDLFPPKESRYITPASETRTWDLLREMNRDHLAQRDGDSRLEARIASYEMAARLQLSAPEVLDVAGESEATRKLYGLDDKVTEDFGRNCLIARRMAERGVRFVQVWSGAGGASGNWDNHSDINKELPLIATKTDKPVAALVKDLKARGMFEDTLLIWTTEFGRMPFAQNSVGRDHNGGTFVSWMAGAGIKAGVAFGESDEWSWKALRPSYCYDLHATILHLLGIDHEKLTFRNNGSNRRLTDVHGEVIEQLLA